MSATWLADPERAITMTRRRGWEIDDPTREAWARALRGAVATLEVTEAPRGWKGWSLAAERLKDPYKMSVFLWEPGAPRPEGLAVATPGLTPTILLILGFSGSDVVWGRDLRAPNMRTDQQTALTVMTLVAHAGQALAEDWWKQ